MASIEQGRQESFGLNKEIIASIDAQKIQLEETQKAMESLNDWIEIEINENFTEMCNTLRKWNDKEKELVKLKLLMNLWKVKNLNMDYNKVTVGVEKDNLGKDIIVLKEEFAQGTVSWTKVYKLTSEWGKWYYDRRVVQAMR